MFTNWKSFFNQSNLLTKLVVINVAVFLIINLTAVFLRLGGFNNYGIISSILSANSSFLETLYRPWSIITYQFTHEGLWHLAMNMLVLYFLAQIFASMLGEKKLLPLYILGGISGWLLYAVSYNIFPSQQLFQHGPLHALLAQIPFIIFGCWKINKLGMPSKKKIAEK